jgi:hypothetical protein
MDAEQVLDLGRAPLAAAIRDGVKDLGERRQRRTVRLVDAQRSALAREHRELATRLAPRHLRGQAGLADAALASEQDEPRRSLAGLREIGAEHLERLGPADHRRAVEIVARTRTRSARWRIGEDGAELPSHVGRVPGPVVGGLLEQGEDQRLERRRYVLCALRRWRRRQLEVRVGDGHRAVGREGRLTRDDLVEDAAQRIEIRARIDDVAAQLLGRDVGDRPEAPAHHLEVLSAMARDRARREAEVHEHRPLLGHEDVVRLEIEVDHPFAVEERERIAEGRHAPEELEAPGERRRRTRGARCGTRTTRDRTTLLLGAEREGFIGGGRVATEQPPQRGALEQLHRVPRRGILEAHVEDAHDARMPEAGERPHLAPKTGQERRIDHPHRLERGLDAGLAMHHPVDDPHAAHADATGDPVGAEVGGVTRERTLADRAGFPALGRCWALGPRHTSIHGLRMLAQGAGEVQRAEHPRPSYSRAGRGPFMLAIPDGPAYPRRPEKVDA